MSKNTHTPGPWEVTTITSANQTIYGVRAQEFGSDNVYPGHLVSDTRHSTAVRGQVVHGWWTDHEADAKLIAAAPDLLAALQGVVSHNAALKQKHKLSPSLMRQIEAAIEKTGQPKVPQGRMPHTAWNVLLDGKVIDTVFYDPDCDADYVRRGLIDHDGYDPRIEVEEVV